MTFHIVQCVIIIVITQENNRTARSHRDHIRDRLKNEIKITNDIIGMGLAVYKRANLTDFGCFVIHARSIAGCI